MFGFTLLILVSAVVLAAADNYDWDAPARIFNHESAAKGRKENPELVFDESSVEDALAPPSDPQQLEEMVRRHGLRHGDILNYDSFRFAITYIVKRDVSGSHSFIRNPDEAGAGYITIPENILRPVTNGLEKYSKVMELVSNESFNLHLSPYDVTVKKMLDGQVHPGWKFDFMFIGTTLEVYIKKAGGDWEYFPYKLPQ